MATYSDINFNSADYDLFRPTYPSEFYAQILAYHTGGIEKYLDVGCGPGLSTFPLAENFGYTLGTDVSQKMCSEAEQIMQAKAERGKTVTNTHFKQSPSEDLTGIGVTDSSIDLVTAAECVHWFDSEKWLVEMSRLLKSGGTLAYWGYIEPVFVNPVANEIYDAFAFSDADFCGPCWQQPGKDRLRNYLKEANDLIANRSDFVGIQTVYFDQSSPSQDAMKPLYIYRKMKLSRFMSFLRTYSALFEWYKRHPEVFKGSEEDIAVRTERMFEEKLGWHADTEVEIVWIQCIRLPGGDNF